MYVCIAMLKMLIVLVVFNHECLKKRYNVVDLGDFLSRLGLQGVH